MSDVNPFQLFKGAGSSFCVQSLEVLFLAYDTVM